MLKIAYAHDGTSFVRILQRCPTYSSQVFAEMQRDPSHLLLLTGGDNPELGERDRSRFPNQLAHDSRDIGAARQLADQAEPLPIGVLYRDPDRPRYETFTTQGLEMSVADKLAGLEREIDKFAV